MTSAGSQPPRRLAAITPTLGAPFAAVRRAACWEQAPLGARQRQQTASHHRYTAVMPGNRRCGSLVGGAAGGRTCRVVRSRSRARRKPDHHRPGPLTRQAVQLRTACPRLAQSPGLPASVLRRPGRACPQWQCVDDCGWVPVSSVAIRSLSSAAAPIGGGTPARCRCRPSSCCRRVAAGTPGTFPRAADIDPGIWKMADLLAQARTDILAACAPAAPDITSLG